MSSDRLKESVAAYRASEAYRRIKPVIDELYREEVLRARATSPEEKFMAGEELFEYACSITLAGIRNQNPEFTEEDCRRELDRRLKLGERLERMERRK